MTIEDLNALPAGEALAAFERCCGARAWASAMAAARPYRDRAALIAAGERTADGLERADWIEAFAHHPMIGDRDALARKFATTAAWASEEQRGATDATDVTLGALAEGNRAYLARFGYGFIVCATGKSAEEMLDILRARLECDADTELGNAAREQRAITRLRLEKLLDEPA